MEWPNGHGEELEETKYIVKGHQRMGPHFYQPWQKRTCHVLYWPEPSSSKLWLGSKFVQNILIEIDHRSHSVIPSSPLFINSVYKMIISKHKKSRFIPLQCGWSKLFQHDTLFREESFSVFRLFCEYGKNRNDDTWLEKEKEKEKSHFYTSFWSGSQHKNIFDNPFLNDTKVGDYNHPSLIWRTKKS